MLKQSIPGCLLLLALIAITVGTLIVFPLWPGPVNAQNKPPTITASEQAFMDHVSETHEHFAEVDRRLDALEHAETEKAIALGRIETATDLIRDFLVVILASLVGLIVERIQDRVSR